MFFASGTTYHDLLLLQYCGGGAFGEVYYCRDLSGKLLAVKIISKSRLGNDWKRELRGVTNYRSITENAPELLQIYHVGEDEEFFYYTMEAADNRGGKEYLPDTLTARLADGAFAPEMILPFLRDILTGITVIHRAGFAHRDIKPDNILFVKGKPKIGDIGLVSSLAISMTQMAGTLDFVPPEQRIADNLTASDRASRQRSDLYALGKVIYCIATGQGAQAWPTIPADMGLSLPLKLFIRLAFRLCERDTAKRIQTLGELKKELADIERKILYGETLRDKVVYTANVAAREVKSTALRLLKWSRKHWLLLSCMLLAVGAAAWYWWPEPPYDIAKQQTKQYVRPDLKFSMTIPFQWEVISSKTLLKMFDEATDNKNDNDPKKQKLREIIMEMTQFKGDMIRCDYDQNNPDNITVQIAPVPREHLINTPDDQLRDQLRDLCQGQLGFKTEIYEVKRMTLAGVPCVYLDLSHDPENIRINNYIIALKDQCVSIALTAGKSTFSQRREQFNSILTTLKIEK